jgi:hypothetical protein
MATGPATVDGYLSGLDPERREVVSAVRKVVNAAMPDGYEEGISYGMIGWSVPLERYPKTYNGQPLGYAGLAAQKRYYSLYLNCVYAGSVAEAELRRRWEAGGRRLDMGKSCLRFRKLDDLDLGVLTEVVASTPVEEFIGAYERSRAR